MMRKFYFWILVLTTFINKRGKWFGIGTRLFFVSKGKWDAHIFSNCLLWKKGQTPFSFKPGKCFKLCLKHLFLSVRDVLNTPHPTHSTHPTHPKRRIHGWNPCIFCWRKKGSKWRKLGMRIVRVFCYEVKMGSTLFLRDNLAQGSTIAAFWPWLLTMTFDNDFWLWLLTTTNLVLDFVNGIFIKMQGDLGLK